MPKSKNLKFRKYCAKTSNFKITVGYLEPARSIRPLLRQKFLILSELAAVFVFFTRLSMYFRINVPFPC